MSNYKENKPKKVHVSRIGKTKDKYPKVDLGDGGGKLSIKTHLNNIWQKIYSLENSVDNMYESHIEDQILERIIKMEKKLKHIKRVSAESDSDTSDSSLSEDFVYQEKRKILPINGKPVEAIIDHSSEINIINKEMAEKLGVKIDKDTCSSEVTNKRYARIPEQCHNSVREFYNQLKNYALVENIHDEDTINWFFMRGLNKKLQLVAFAESFAQKDMPLDEWVTKLAEVEKICQLLSQDTS